VEGDPGEQEIGRTTEREVKVVISSTFGHVRISRGEPEKIVVAETVGGGSSPMHLSYSIRNRIGYLEITLGEPSDGEKKHGIFRVHSLDGGTWTLRFGDALPISFDIEQGVGKGEYDMSGLRVKDFTLNNGASDVLLMFNEPNPAVIENLSIESGVGKFSGLNLGNANFNRFHFQGGVGSSSLDFSGALNREVDVDVELALGTLSILVPQETGARVFYEEGWMSRIDYDRDFTKVGDTEYSSENYGTARGRMNIRIEAGLGRVKLRRP
jgi:predicted membrane protein